MSSSSPPSPASSELKNLLEDALTKFGAISLPDPDPRELSHFCQTEQWIPYLSSEYTLYPTAQSSFLGKGGFGSAFKVKSVRDPEEPIRVAKVLSKDQLSKKLEHVQHLVCELAVAGYIPHHNLNHRTGLFHNHDVIFVILELCAGPRPDVLTRIAHVICRRRPTKIPQIPSVYYSWAQQAKENGIDPSDENAFGNFVDDRGLINNLARQCGAEIARGEKPEIPVACDFLHYIIPHGRLADPVTRVIIRQILLGVGHLHQCNVVHRDLKIENVVVAVHRKAQLHIDPVSDNVTSVSFTERFEVKVIDFGMVKYMNVNDSAFGKTVTPGGFIRASQDSQHDVVLQAAAQVVQQTNTNNNISPNPLPVPKPSPSEDSASNNNALVHNSSRASAASNAAAASIFGGGGGGAGDDFTSMMDPGSPFAAGNLKGLSAQLDKNKKQSEMKEAAVAPSKRQLLVNDIEENPRKSSNPNILLFGVSCTPGAGTLLYTSPESLQGLLVNDESSSSRNSSSTSTTKWVSNNMDLPKVDVFGVGNILYCALEGRTPFKAPPARNSQEQQASIKSLISQMNRRGGLEFRPATSQLAKDLISKMLEFEVGRRYNTADCLEHEYVNRVGDSVVTEFNVNPQLSWCKLERDVIKERQEKKERIEKEEEEKARIEHQPEQQQQQKQSIPNPLNPPCFRVDDDDDDDKNEENNKNGNDENDMNPNNHNTVVVVASPTQITKNAPSQEMVLEMIRLKEDDSSLGGSGGNEEEDVANLSIAISSYYNATKRNDDDDENEHHSSNKNQDEEPQQNNYSNIDGAVDSPDRKVEKESDDKNNNNKEEHSSGCSCLIQ